ncbi:MAG: hypothetical protein JWM90_202 [Thermoleophilia bacterium]|nr:hypothetical protein [Thermoleophilia bacterium]
MEHSDTLQRRRTIGSLFARLVGRAPCAHVPINVSQHPIFDVPTVLPPEPVSVDEALRRVDVPVVIPRTRVVRGTVEYPRPRPERVDFFAGTVTRPKPKPADPA